jgi:hemophore-related protein
LMPVGVITAASPASADCTNAGNATVCAQGTVRGGGPTPPSAGYPSIVPIPGIATTAGTWTSSGIPAVLDDPAEAAVSVRVVESCHPVLPPIRSKESRMFVRSLVGAGMIAGAMLVGTSATAAADPPNCTAADLAGVMSGVSAGTSAYLFTHPDVNDFFTSLKGKPRDEMRTDVETYMDANPQVSDELKNVRQSAADFRERCNAPMPEMPMG